MLRQLTTMVMAIAWTHSVFASSNGSTFLTPNLEISRMPRTISLTPNEENDDFCPYVFRGVNEDDGYIVQREKMLNAQFTALHSW